MKAVAMLSGWKIGRELTRIRQQLQAIPEYFTEPRALRRHDAAFDAGFPIRDGAIGVQPNVALMLVYQPSGIAESTVDTCRHLVAKGYAPLVISNTPISRHDGDRLAPHVWQILERPNFGYDFGGYRDGLRLVASQSVAPERVLILNDSQWFPVFDEETLIDECEAITTGIAGTTLRERADEMFLESHFLMVPGQTLKAPAFERYWSELLLTSNKYKVIRRGERGFSDRMRAAGVPLTPVFPYNTFLSSLQEQDEGFLRKTLNYAHLLDEPAERRRHALLESDGPDWRDQALALIADTIPRRQPYSAYPFAMAVLHGYPLLKKSMDAASIGWRRVMVQAWEDGALPRPRDVVWTELMELQSKTGDARGSL